MSNTLVSIIIVSAGKKDYLEPLLESIKRQAYKAQEVITIDNKDRKLSFCDCLNKGIAMSRADFILCLNDDVILDEKFIERAIEAFYIDEKIGLVSGKILRFDKTTIDSTGLFLSVWRTAKERGYGVKDIGQFEKGGYVFGVTGAVALYRRNMLEEIKQNNEYFDSRFRFFYEDLDVAWRAHKLGWKGYYMPGALAYHIRGGTARQPAGIGKRFARRYINRELHLCLIKNRYRTIAKNETVFGLLLHLPFILLYDIFALSYLITEIFFGRLKETFCLQYRLMK